MTPRPEPSAAPEVPGVLLAPPGFEHVFNCNLGGFAYRTGIVARRSGPARNARFFATAAKGTEPLLAAELQEIGLPLVRPSRGGVYFGSAVEHAFRACLWSRIALRVHEPLASFECRDGDDLYDGVRGVDWSRYVSADHTLAVRAAGRNERLIHTHFIAVRAKDAVVDQLRDAEGARPSVSRDDPDVLLFVHVVGERATVNLDYSGGSLHEHGFRSPDAVAPIRETLAAALVRFSGWSGESPLLDPMCGSGTLLLEAGLWAARRAPGLERQFGFERWRCFDERAARRLAELRAEARAAERPAPPLYGCDTDPRALAQTRANAAKVGVRVELESAPVALAAPRWSEGGLITNPPYGERLATTESLERDIEAMLDRFATHQRALIVPSGFPRRVRASRWLTVYNGPIECELRRYDARREETAQSPSA